MRRSTWKISKSFRKRKKHIERNQNFTEEEKEKKRQYHHECNKKSFWITKTKAGGV